MPYSAHPELDTPLDETIIWRYLSLSSFLELLQYQTLWFARADTFEDPLEGTLTDAERQNLIAGPVVLPTPSGPLSVGASIINGINELRTTMYINCWRAGGGESMAMWDIYGKHGNVIAIKSTVALLKEALNEYPKSIYIAEVKYVDWNQAGFHNNIIPMHCRKDESYSHEAEVRALIWAAGAETGAPLFPYIAGANHLNPKGVAIPIDFQKMITEVRIGPREQARLHDLLLRIMAKYEMRQPVVISNRLQIRD